MSGRNLTEGPIWKALARVSAPMSFGILAVLSVGVVDAYYLGRVSSSAQAAIGFIFPVTTAVSSLSIGLSAGANAVISQALGRDDDAEDTVRLGMHALIVGVALGLAVAVAAYLAYPLLFPLLGAGDEVMREVHAYMPVWAAGFPFLVGMMIVNAMFRAHGRGVTTAAIMVLSAAVNIGLTPVFIFGYGPFGEMGTTGASLGSTVARVVAFALALGWAWHRDFLSVCSKPMKGFARSTTEILRVGAPAALSNALNPAGMALVTAAVATVGTAAVAGFGAATRVIALTQVPLLALSSGIGPVVGQNWGADKVGRARDAMGLTWVICAAYGLAAGLVLALFADQISALIAAGEEEAGYSATFLRLTGWTMIGYGMVITTNAAMNGRSKAVWSMSLSLIRIFGLYLPLAWLGVSVAGYIGIAWAAVAANLAGAAIAMYFAYRTELFARVQIRRYVGQPLQETDAA